MDYLVREIQVNVPFRMLRERYLDLFIEKEINPEIGLDGDALDSYTESDFTETAKRLHDRELTVTLHAPFIDLSPGSPDSRIQEVTRKRFEQVLRLVPLFNAKTVVCHAGFDRRRYCSFRDQWLDRSIQMWSWLGSRLIDKGCRLMLENVYEDKPYDMISIFENLKGCEVEFCLDTGHQNAFGSAPLEEWLAVLGHYLGQLHLHDNDGGWDDHLAIGRGSVDFALLFQWLKVKRPNPPVITLEPHKEEDLLPSLESLEKLWVW